MYESLQMFIENSPEIFEKIFSEFFNDESCTLGDVVKDVKKQTDALARKMIVEVLEMMDKEIKDNPSRVDNYEVIRNDVKSLLSTVGSLTYHRTYYINKRNNERTYLLDKAIGVTRNNKKTEDVVERILEHACEASYRISGNDATFTEDIISKQTVMNVLRSQEISDPTEQLNENDKKKVTNLYINADEDHVSLQFRKIKGDLTLDEAGYKNNTYMPRLIYLFDGIMPEGEHSKRKKLMNRVCFTEKTVTEKPVELWELVMDYINQVYDYEFLKKIYIVGDGASWIKTGLEVLGSKACFALDKYHLNKSIVSATAFLGEEASIARTQIWDTISAADKDWLEETFKNLKELAVDENTKSRIDDCRRYMINHWSAIIIRSEDDDVPGCSAEGLISHIFAARLSSRPLGWSKEGANKMAQLRVYSANGGKIVDLITYKKLNAN